MSNCRPRTLSGVRNQVLYVTGPVGPQGPRGVQGEVGPTGPTGPVGPMGPSTTLAYGTFFNTGPATISPLGTVPLPYSQACPLPEEMCLVNNSIMLCEAGIYMVDYTIYATSDNTQSFGLFLSDNLVTGSATEGININHANVLINPSISRQLLRLVNIGNNNVTLLSPSSSINNVIVTVLKVG